MLVVLRDGRKIIGMMRSFDQFANIVLEEAVERLIVGKQFADVPLGLYVIRGENVVLLGEMVRVPCTATNRACVPSTANPGAACPCSLCRCSPSPNFVAALFMFSAAQDEAKEATIVARPPPARKGNAMPMLVGQRVMAQFGVDDDEDWFPGIVAAVHADGKIDVQYDDGDEEQRKDPARVRRDATGAAAPSADERDASAASDDDE